MEATLQTPGWAGPPKSRVSRVRQPRFAMMRLAWALLLLLALQNQAGASGGPLHETVLPGLDTCRFLMGAATEARQPLDPERLNALYALLDGTRIGAMVVAYLQRFQQEGLKPEGKPLRFYKVEREGGPAAAYFESGELHLSSALLPDEGVDDREALNRLYTAASFLVHEGIHAISHHFYLTGRFPIYRSDTMVNEALAYFVQGLYLDEVRELDPGYYETLAVPAWDVCTAEIVRILDALGIDRETSPETVNDLLAELQLETDHESAMRLARLWQYYQFIIDSEESDQLWELGDAVVRPQAVVRAFTDMIAEDVENRRCNFRDTFAFMRDRIILYAHYPPTPPGVPGCQYFVDFVHALRADDEISDALKEQIDRWLRRKGLASHPGETT